MFGLQIPGHFVAMFNEHGIAPEHNPFVMGIIRELGADLHSYLQFGNKHMPPEAGTILCMLEQILPYV
jgi:hypothetical protein